MPLTTDLKAPLGAVRSSARSWLRAFAGALAILCTQPGPALAADETADNSESGDAPDAAASTLELYLEPRAPYESWLVHLVNTGSAGVSIPWDPRLLWMDVQVPGRSKPTRCRLPQVMLPTKPSSVQLASGVDAVFAIDPRFYCFDAGEQTTLVPGAFITAHYGYPLATRKRWVGGQAVDEPKSDQRSPFLLERDAVGESLKEVEAPGFALGSEFQVWSHTRLKRTATAAPAAPLQLRISSGTDSHSASDAAVGVTLTNISDEAVPVYFYREGLSFVVYGPGGGMRCGGSAALRAPSAERFITLRPGRAETVSMRLAELCGRGLFARPGYYLVTAEFSTRYLQSEGPRGAFFGDLHAHEPRLLRVRTGPLPFSPTPPMAAEVHRASPPGPRPRDGQ